MGEPILSRPVGVATRCCFPTRAGPFQTEPGLDGRTRGAARVGPTGCEVGERRGRGAYKNHAAHDRVPRRRGRAMAHLEEAACERPTGDGVPRVLLREMTPTKHGQCVDRLPSLKRFQRSLASSALTAQPVSGGLPHDPGATTMRGRPHTERRTCEPGTLVSRLGVSCWRGAERMLPEGIGTASVPFCEPPPVCSRTQRTAPPTRRRTRRAWVPRAAPPAASPRVDG